MKVRAGWVVAVACCALAAVLPFVPLHVPGLLPGPDDVVNSVGNLSVIAICFVFGAVALGYDVLFGYAGMLSLGPVLHFAAGIYAFDIAMTNWGWSLWASLAFTFGVCLGISLLVGAIALRVTGIAFTMVTLAFAQAFYLLIEDNPHNLTGGDTGLAFFSNRLPQLLSGAVSNTKNLYWVSLCFLVAVALVVHVLLRSSAGRALLGVRDNESRAAVLGLRPYGFRLAAYVLSSMVISAAGIVYLLLIGTAVPGAVASTTLTLSIVVMVMIGGAASQWWALAGGILYWYLESLLIKVASQPSFSTLPAALRVPLSQPQFLLGAVFIAIVFFAPGGIAGVVLRLRLRRRGILSVPQPATTSVLKGLFTGRGRRPSP